MARFSSAGSDLIDANCSGSSLKVLLSFSLSVPFGRFVSDMSALTLNGRRDTCAVRSFSRSGCESASPFPSPGDDMLSFSNWNRYLIPSQRAHNVLSRSANIERPRGEKLGISSHKVGISVGGTRYFRPMTRPYPGAEGRFVVGRCEGISMLPHPQVSLPRHYHCHI